MWAHLLRRTLVIQRKPTQKRDAPNTPAKYGWNRVSRAALQVFWGSYSPMQMLHVARRPCQELLGSEL